MSIQQKIQQLKEDFAILPDWQQKYEYIIELRKKLPPLDEKYKTEKYLVRGCQSQVWLRQYEKEDKVFFEADSDALITKGIVALLISVLQGSTKEEINRVDFGFLDEIGIKNHLSMARVNGLASVIKKMYKCTS